MFVVSSHFLFFKFSLTIFKKECLSHFDPKFHNICCFFFSYKKKVINFLKSIKMYLDIFLYKSVWHCNWICFVLGWLLTFGLDKSGAIDATDSHGWWTDHNTSIGCWNHKLIILIGRSFALIIQIFTPALEVAVALHLAVMASNMITHF